MSWLNGWGYRKSHSIGPATGAGINYQVAIKVYYGSGTDGTEAINGGVTAGKVYCENKCKTDFGDIRFTVSDGVILLNYWLEEKVDENYAIFWVQITDSLESDAQTIYIYYGKADATTTNDGDTTFLLFDHFLGDTLDDTKWATITLDGGGGSVSLANSIITILGTAPYGMIGLYSKTAFPQLSSVRALGLIGITQLAYQITKIGWFKSDGTNLAKTVNSFDSISGTHYAITGDGTFYELTSIGSTHFGDWFIYEVQRKGNGVGTSYWRGTQNPRNSAYDQDVNRAVGGATRDTEFTTQIDWILVRKYVSPEPAHGIWGSEETPPSVPVFGGGIVGTLLLIMGDD